MNRLNLFVIPTLAVCGMLIAIDCFGTTGEDASKIHVQDFSIGFSGNYKIGSWTPVYVSLEAPTGEHLSLLLTVPDGDGVPTTTTIHYLVPPHANGSTTVVEMFCKIGRPDGEIGLAVHQKDRSVAGARYRLEATDYRPLPSTAELIVSLGTAPNLRSSCTRQLNSEGPRTVVAEMGEADRLPSHALGYDGVDQVFCSGSRSALKQFLNRDRAISALANWVRWGGQLVMSIGGNDVELLQEKGFFEKFFPGRFEKVVSTRQLRPIEILGGGSDPLIKEDERGRSQPFVIPFFRTHKGRVESTLRQGGQSIPLLVRSAMGFGQVTLLAVDIEQSEFTTWNGTRNLIRNILFLAQKEQVSNNLSSGGELAHSGYDDLAGQLRAALDQFEGQGVWFIPFELLFLFGALYLLLITVGDYFLLRRLRGKMELTWFTFPLMVILCSVGIYGVARATKGDRQLINQAEVIDIDTLSGQVRSSCWFSLFSPQTERYDLSANCRLRVDGLQRPKTGDQTHDENKTAAMLFSWMGLPGTGLGGMESPLVTPVFEQGYRYGPQLASLEHVPLSIWSTKCFSIRLKSFGFRAADSTLTERNLGDDALIEGSITNRLKQPLRDCVLLHNGWAYPLGTLEPNKPHSIDRSGSVRTIRNYLTRLGPLEMENEKQRFEVQRIFERILLYQASGGAASIVLKNDYLNVLDMSHLLENREAILMGVADQSSFEINNGKQILSDSKSLRAAVYRIILPIQHFDSRQEATRTSPKATPPVSPYLFVREDQS